MTREEFDTLVQHHARRAAASPERFKTEVGAFAAFGFLYMLGVFLLMAALTLGALVMIVALPNGLTVKFGLFVVIAAGGVALAIGRGLWVRLESPTGLKLTPSDAPRLFELVADIGRRMQAPAFHEILVVPEYNAAVVQIPRLGILGWYRNHLLLGLPLMQSLGPDEFSAVLAHEFGHLSRSHGRFGNWIYRLRRSWQQVFEQLSRQKQGTFAFPLTRFIDWYWPRFNARAFVLSRGNEYEADDAASQAVSAPALASALMRLQVDGTFIADQFWPAVFRKAGVERQPPPDVYHQLGRSLGEPRDPAALRRWLQVGFRLETNNADTHPCLRDRLRALGQLSSSGEAPETLPPLAGPSAADAFLGTMTADLERRLGESWSADVVSAWQHRFEEVSALAAQQGDNTPGTTDSPPNADQLWRRAEYALQVDPPTVVLPLLEQIVSLDPKHAGAQFHRGRILLEADDPRGVEPLEAAMRQDVMATEAVCQALYGYYVRTGQRDRLPALENQIEAFRVMMAEAGAERAHIQAKDTFLPHGVDAESVQATVGIVASEPVVARANLVRKGVRHFPDRPCFILALEVRRPWWKPVGSDANQKLAERVASKVPVPGCVVIIIHKDLKPLGRAIAAVPGACIYSRTAR